MNQREYACDVSVIVVNWNTRELLSECLNSVRDYPAVQRTHEVIVVDNGSQDGSQEMIRRDFPEVRLISNPTNVGFQRANNQALRTCGGATILLLNADARLTPGCLDELLACFDSDPAAAAAGPRLVYGDGRWQRWTAGRDPSVRSAAAHFLGFERLHPIWHGCQGVYLGQDVQTAFQPDWVSSACMLVRRSAVDQVGLLDERFFAYMDDVDLCYRLRLAGWHVWYCPRGEAVHHMGQSTRRQTGKASPLALRNFNRYFALRHGRLATLGLQAMQVAGFSLRVAVCLALSRFGRRGSTAALRDRARAHWLNLKVSVEPVRGL